MAETIAIISVIVALLGAGFAGFSCFIMKRALHMQAVRDLYREYSSNQMHSALHALWCLHADCRGDPDRFRAAYLTYGDDPAIPMRKYQRQVTHFYDYLAHLYVRRWLPGKLIFSQWATSDLEIIPKILVPLENAVREQCENVKVPDDWPPLKLYEASKNPRFKRKGT